MTNLIQKSKNNNLNFKHSLDLFKDMNEKDILDKKYLNKNIE